RSRTIAQEDPPDRSWFGTIRLTMSRVVQACAERRLALDVAHQQMFLEHRRFGQQRSARIAYETVAIEHQFVLAAGEIDICNRSRLAGRRGRQHAMPVDPLVAMVR